METNEIKMDLRVKCADGHEGLIIDYQSGWVVVEMDDHSVSGVKDGNRSIRAKTLTVIPSKEGDPQPLEETLEDVVDDVEPGAEIEVTCGICLLLQYVTVHENIKCAGCGNTLRVRLHPDKEKYITGKGTTASGRDTVDIADNVADMFRGDEKNSKSHMDAIELAASIVDEIGYKVAMSKAMSRNFDKFCIGKDPIDQTVERFLEEKYDHLNPGMVRMNCGNLVRGAYSRQEKSEVKK